MDSTTPAQQQDATTATPNFDTLAMVTAAAVANNPSLNMAAAALLATPNSHFLNALNAFPLYSVAGTTSLLNAIVATNTAPLQSTVTPQQTATAGTSFLAPQQHQPSVYSNLLSSAGSHCSCAYTPNGNVVPPQNHPAMSAPPTANGQDDRPTPSNLLRSSRKRPLQDGGIRGSGSTRQPSAKYQRVSSSTRRPDTPTPIITPSESPPRIQAPSTNLVDNFLDSVINTSFAQDQQQSAAAMSRAISGFNSRNLAAALFQQHHQQQNIQQSPVPQQQTQQSCPVCQNRQLPQTPGILSPVVGLQSSSISLATSSQANLLPTNAQAAFVLPPNFPQAPPLQLPRLDENPTGACMCTGFHCARCNGTDQQRADEFGAYLGRMAQSGANAQAQLNAAAAATTTQIPAEFFAMAMNRVQQQFSQVTAPAQQAQPRIRYPNQMLQQQLALLQSTVPATLNRSLPHQMTRTSSLNGTSPFPTNIHPDHLNMLNRRQHVQNQTNDYTNRFYSSNPVALPQQTQPTSTPLQQAQHQLGQSQPNPMDLQNNHIALRATRLAAAPAAANTLTPYHPNHPSWLLFHNINYHLAANDIHPMIVVAEQPNNGYVFGNPEAMTHAVATAMHHAPEPQPVGASSDQIKRCTQIRNYIKDLEVPEQERERCTVCLMDFETGEDIRTLHCSHMFHIDCIDRWLAYNKKCPVCRVDMDKLPMLITDNEETLSLSATAQ